MMRSSDLPLALLYLLIFTLLAPVFLVGFAAWKTGYGIVLAGRYALNLVMKTFNDDEN